MLKNLCTILTMSLCPSDSGSSLSKSSDQRGSVEITALQIKLSVPVFSEDSLFHVGNVDWKASPQCESCFHRSTNTLLLQPLLAVRKLTAREVWSKTGGSKTFLFLMWSTRNLRKLCITNKCGEPAS